MPIDAETIKKIKALRERREFWLSRRPPETVEADRCLDRIDALLDARPAVHAVAPDGEVIYDNAPEWLKGQVIVVNDTLVPERVLGIDDEQAVTGHAAKPAPKVNKPKVPNRPEQKAHQPITQADLDHAAELLDRLPVVPDPIERGDESSN